MRTDISAEQTARYRADGYTIIEDFLSPDELAEWREAVEAAAERRWHAEAPADGHPLRNDQDDDYFRRVFTQCVNLWQVSDHVKRLILDERIGRIATELAGVEGVRVWHDQSLIKEPWANPTPWHLDCPLWPFHNDDSISIWVALDDATVENGCMYFIPGSHTEAKFDRNADFGPQMRQLFDVYPQWAEREAVPITMRAGSCSFHNGMLAHGAGANMTPGRRRAMTCIYMPLDATFSGVQDILTDTQMATLKVGDPLDDDVRNPIVYPRSA